MSIFENLKKVLEIHVFFWLSDHNALISDFYVKYFVTIKNMFFAYFMAAHYVVFYAFFKIYLEIMK
jgi:hypothetical protein